MADAKRERQRLARQARLEAERRAQARAARQRWAILGGALCLLVAAVVLFLNRDDGGSDVAVGERCVAPSEPLPEGAPSVPVRTGAPPSDLVVEDLVEGSGPEVPEEATVTVHYVGVTCSTGVVFDSSYSRGQPATFSLSGVIEGWTEGIPGMHVGGRRLLGIPPDKAYGAQGQPPDIGPDETLWFVVEMLEVQPE